MALRLLSIEIRKTVKHPALWIGLACLAVFQGLILFASHAQIASGFEPASGGLESDLLQGMSMFQLWLGVFAYAVTAAVIVAFDYPDRSIQLWLVHGVSRPLLLGVRLFAILLFSLLIIVFAFASLLGLAALSRLLFFGAIDSANLNASALPIAVLRVFWSALPYLALTTLFAIASRSPIFAAGGTIVYTTVVEKLLLSGLPKYFPALTKYLPIVLTGTLQTANLALDRSASLEAFAIPQTQAIVFIGVWFTLIILISLVIFTRQDLGG